MTYAERLYPWAIIRLLPRMQRVVVGRYRNRSDAEGHLRVLKRLMPDGEFLIIFDLPELMDQETEGSEE
ncbi:hypothetical protein [Moorena sp. SIO4G3]|uniref:hypothetical protein n=1 Tax=Moorena sp. SIO4G3 TaxID=2607821 RepID=UPI00142A0C43|nr:hypothetical protein [Moorena sp. SIO4G3]NEO81897.1 hypothetical protein [Moorena sp. SIO4G3]